VPLYVLTFVGNSPPNEILAEYLKLKVDTYYPSPIRCNRCCRWGHFSASCPSAEKPKCPNCKGDHSALNKECPNYIREFQACHLTVDEKISFKEAREKVYAQNNPKTTSTCEIDEFNINQHSFPQLKNSTQNAKYPISQTTRQNDVENRQARANASDCSTHSSKQKTRFPKGNIYNLSSTCNSDMLDAKMCKHNSNNLTPFSSPASSIITPAQRSKRHQTCHSKVLHRSTISPDANQSFVLPSPLERSPPLLRNASQAEIQHNSNSQPLIDLQKFLTSLLPLLLKLILAQNVTDRIDCFMELGNKLNAESTTSKLLQNINCSDSHILSAVQK